MKLHNTLTRQVEEFNSINPGKVRMYSCGPTVYDHIHIGNLSSFVYADTLRRALQLNGFNVRHVMNFTDVDDKTIRRSREKFPDVEPIVALKQLTKEYSDFFLSDMKSIGNDTEAIEFISAVESMETIRQIIGDLHKDGFGYIAEDGVYFSIQKYRESGKKYGQLTEITEQSTASARISNDEYDKDNIHDFALWKSSKDDEPAWEFEIDGQDVAGRPGWHIECSAMSTASLGMPFDIHTGGIDLIFPHHENEIAQSTAGQGNVYAKHFFHNEHLLVEGKKMSKSLNNFYTLHNVQEKGFDPLAFRLMVLQSHYRNQSNFSWNNLEAAQNRLQTLRAMADLRWQNVDGKQTDEYKGQLNDSLRSRILTAINNDLGLPEALRILSESEPVIVERYTTQDKESLTQFVLWLDQLFGLQLLSSKDITSEQKELIKERQAARTAKNWEKSDILRDELQEQGLAINDTEQGPVWSRV